jgi:hypothetical protein
MTAMAMAKRAAGRPGVPDRPRGLRHTTARTGRGPRGHVLRGVLPSNRRAAGSPRPLRAAGVGASTVHAACVGSPAEAARAGSRWTGGLDDPGRCVVGGGCRGARRRARAGRAGGRSSAPEFPGHRFGAPCPGREVSMKRDQQAQQRRHVRRYGARDPVSPARELLPVMDMRRPNLAWSRYGHHASGSATPYSAPVHLATTARPVKGPHRHVVAQRPAQSRPVPEALATGTHLARLCSTKMSGAAEGRWPAERPLQ